MQLLQLITNIYYILQRLILNQQKDIQEVLYMIMLMKIKTIQQINFPELKVDTSTTYARGYIPASSEISC